MHGHPRAMAIPPSISSMAIPPSISCTLLRFAMIGGSGTDRGGELQSSASPPDMAPDAAFDCVCFTFIVDDIVLPCGTTCMEQLGGGGPQTLFGFQLVHTTLHEGRRAKIALAAGVGPDVPASCLDWLSRLSCDMEGLIRHERPTPRAWQVFEADGRRTQVWRGLGDPCDELYSMLRPRVDNLPPAYRQAINYHLGVHPLHPPLKLLRTLRAAAHASGGVLSVEPYTAAERPATPEEVQALLSECDIFSPNLAEAASMVGQGQPLELAARLLAAAGSSGASLVVIRCAEQGVVAQLGRGGPTCQVPAVADTRVVDVTGAGNAFCGGFLAALHASGPASPLHRAVRRTDQVVVQNPAGDDPQGHGPGAAGAVAGAMMCAGAEAAAGVAAAEDAAAVRVDAARAAAAVGPSGDLDGDGLGEALARAAAWGCVASSLIIEEAGVPQTPLQVLQGRAQRRFDALAARVRWRCGGAGAGAVWVGADGGGGGEGVSGAGGSAGGVVVQAWPGVRAGWCELAGFCVARRLGGTGRQRCGLGRCASRPVAGPSTMLGITPGSVPSRAGFVAARQRQPVVASQVSLLGRSRGGSAGSAGLMLVGVRAGSAGVSGAGACSNRRRLRARVNTTAPLRPITVPYRLL